MNREQAAEIEKLIRIVTLKGAIVELIKADDDKGVKIIERIVKELEDE